MEKSYKGLSGYFFVLLIFLIIGASVYSFYSEIYWLGVLLGVVTFLLMAGFLVVEPNKSAVLILFGAYKGTIKKNGFYWVNPFFVKKKISLRARNFDSETIKVNDKLGNPIMIGLVLVWKVEDTYKASFGVDAYEHFVVVQSEAALRKLAGMYPYDNIEDDNVEILTLREGREEVNDKLEAEIVERLEIAGIHVIEARINHIAYAQEIAHAMLKRQQASAIVSARFKIVEGAVSMVEMALDELNQKEIVDFDEEKKATMVSNLMVVLCGDKDATPVVNTGSIYQ